MSNFPFGFEIPDDSPGFLLWKTTVVWQRLIKKALEKYEISHSQFVIIAILLWWRGKEVDITQVDIVALSKLDKMTVSASLKKLLALKLVSRVESKKDTRAKIVCLTQRGVQLARKLVPLVEEVDNQFFNQLSKKDYKQLVVLLQMLSNN